MQVISVNTNVTHEPGSVIERPSGLPGYLLLNYASPALLLTAKGLCEESPGVCVLYAPGVPQKSVAHNGETRADGVYFAGPEAEPLVSALELPLNAAFYPRDTSFIRPMLSDMITEITRKDRHWERLVVLGLTQLLVTLSRNLDQTCRTPALTDLKAAQRELLQKVRMTAHRELAHPWTIAEMARRAHMSPPRFFALYKEFFGTSPIEDLIQARLESACWLLTNTKVTMEEVAERTGFANGSYFSQVFKKRIGCPPSQYYETHVAP
jgi:AraC-like DNA-binding protein